MSIRTPSPDSMPLGYASSLPGSAVNDNTTPTTDQHPIPRSPDGEISPAHRSSPSANAMRQQLTRQLTGIPNPSEQKDSMAASLASSRQIAQYMAPPGIRPLNPIRVLDCVEIPLKPVPGEVVYFNWDLHEAMTRPAIPCKREMTKALKQEILQRYCLVVDDRSERSDNTVTGYADKYWASDAFKDRTRIKGSGRACILPTGEVLKGVGKTPFAGDGPTHSNGKLTLSESVMEAVSGELYASSGIPGTRVLAILAPP